MEVFFQQGKWNLHHEDSIFCDTISVIFKLRKQVYFDLFLKNTQHSRRCLLFFCLLNFHNSTGAPLLWYCPKFLSQIDVFLARFFYEKNFYKKMSKKTPQNLKKMLRESPALNAWTATFEGAEFCWSFLKVTKLSNS